MRRFFLRGWLRFEELETDIVQSISAADQTDAIRQAKMVIAEYELGHADKYGSLRGLEIDLVLVPTVHPMWRYQRPLKAAAS
jgi:hypothetical protein